MAGAIIIGVAVSAISPLVAVAPFAAIAIAWGWARMPGVLLAAYLFLPFYKATLGPLSPVDLTPFLALLNASQLALLLRTGERSYGSRVGLALWISLGVVVLAGVTWAGQQGLAIDRASFWWALILIPSVAAVRVASESRFVSQFLATGFVVGSLIVLLGLPNVFGPSRLTVLGGNTLQAGAITLIVAIVAIFWVLRIASPWGRLLASALIMVAVVESIASGSRGPLIAFGVALIYGLLTRLRSGGPITRRDLGLTALASIAVVSVAIALTRIPGQSIARILQVSDAVGSGGPIGSSIGARVDLFTLATEMFLDRPVLGHGTAAFAAYTATQPSLVQFTYPHNNLLQLAAEFGVVGAGLFLALVAIALRRKNPIGGAWRAVKLLFVFTLALSFSSGDIYGDRLLWGLLVMVISAPAESGASAPIDGPSVATNHRAPIGHARNRLSRGSAS